LHQALQICIQENLEVKTGDLFIVKKEERICGYYIVESVDNKSIFSRVILEPGAYLITNKCLDTFYEILVNKRIILTKFEDKFHNDPN
jgi:hypothetical protein